MPIPIPCGSSLVLQKATVSRYIQRFEIEGNVETHPRSGRPKSLTEAAEADIINVIQQTGFNNATKIRRDLHLPVSSDTVRRVLKRAGFRNRIPSKKPGMTERHRERRVQFAQQYLGWREQWNQTIFVDEKIFTTDCHGRVVLWRQRGARHEDRNILYHNRQGRVTASFWGSMSAQGLGDLQEVPERMTSAAYLVILRDTMYQNAQQRYPQGMINLVQDNSGPHKGRIVTNWIAQQDRLNCLPWSATSPDLNPIENLWGVMQQRWDAEDMGRNRQNLVNHVFQTWMELADDEGLCQRLVDSMPRRLQAVIDNNGGATRY